MRQRFPHKTPRHRKFQIGISVGITASSAVAVAYPEMSTVAVVIGLCVNYFWIWEE